MTQRIYRSALGKPVDLGALILKNEKERAVSNVNVNARGDVIDNMNKPITSRNQQVNKHYKNSITPEATPVSKSKSKRGEE
jgi:hypothetical protein